MVCKGRPPSEPHWEDRRAGGERDLVGAEVGLAAVVSGLLYSDVGKSPKRSGHALRSSDHSAKK